MKAFRRTAALAALVLAMAAYAAPPDKLLQGAGPTPTDAEASAAITGYFRSINRALNLHKPFKVLSGPTLATGNTFAGGLEQAWLMCIVVNAERVSPGPLDLGGVTLYLRSLGAGQFSVVSTENWKDSSPQCH